MVSVDANRLVRPLRVESASGPTLRAICSEGQPFLLPSGYGRFVLGVSAPAGISGTVGLPAARARCSLTATMEEPKRMRRQLRAMPAGRGYIYLRPDGEHPPNRGERSRPGRSPAAGPGIYCRDLGQKIFGKMASTQFISLTTV